MDDGVEGHQEAMGHEELERERRVRGEEETTTSEMRFSRMERSMELMRSDYNNTILEMGGQIVKLNGDVVNLNGQIVNLSGQMRAERTDLDGQIVKLKGDIVNLNEKIVRMDTIISTGTARYFQHVPFIPFTCYLPDDFVSLPRYPCENEFPNLLHPVPLFEDIAAIHQLVRLSLSPPLPLPLSHDPQFLCSIGWSALVRSLLHWGPA